MGLSVREMMKFTIVFAWFKNSKTNTKIQKFDKEGTCAFMAIFNPISERFKCFFHE